MISATSPFSLRAKAYELADRLGTCIPLDMPLEFWALPLLEKLVERIEELEKEVKKEK